jgi:hypothetical protein
MGDAARATALQMSPEYSAAQIREACRQAIADRTETVATSG